MNMKAVYEMPRVSIEEFTPNVAVANCTQGTYTFDCLKGPQADPTYLISSTIGVTCLVDCGFADYSGTTSGIAGEGTDAVLTTSTNSVLFEGSSHSKFNSTLTWEDNVYSVTTSNQGGHGHGGGQQTTNYSMVSADLSRNFLGWLYIGRGGDTSVTTSFESGTFKNGSSFTEILKLVSSATHLLLAPVYGAQASDVHNS
ncbi:MAG: hypothetical protein ACI4MM_05455 [Candidatus Ventricola sp.]